MLSVGLRAARSRAAASTRPGSDRDDRRRHLVLDREDVLEVAVVALGPEVAVGLGVDQLHGDADALARLAHAALDDVLHAELARDLLHVDRLALVLERRVARDHEQLAEARQLGDDVLGDAVGEEFLLGIAAHVVERQDGDRRLVDALALGRRARRRRRARGAAPSRSPPRRARGRDRRAPARRCS